MLQSNNVFVPGKILISGEHSVVYGEPAVVAAVNLGVSVTLSPSEGYVLESEQKDPLGLVKEALNIVGVDPETVRVKIESTLPVGSGMGSSAALCAAVIKAGANFRGVKLTQEEWFELTWQAEKKAHGNSSGVDPAAVINRGLLWYVRGKPIERFTVSRTYDLLAVQTGMPVESTGEMVVAVAERIKNHESRIMGILKSMGRVTREARRAMERGEELVELFNENETYLEELGVVGKTGIKLIRQLQEMGAGAKVSGAGGIKSGSGLVLVTGNRLDTIPAFFKEHKLAYWEVTIGGV